MSIDKVKELLLASNRIVVFSGPGLCTESNIPDFLSEEESFRTESEFGYSPEDIFSSVFFNTRPDDFFQFYKKYILHLDHSPNAAHFAITRLEQQGKLTGIVTRSIYGLHQVAGSKNVIELHGSIHKNVCTKCGEEYCASYVKSFKGIPTCRKCNSIIRPKIGLFGERIDNGRLTAACKAVESADTLLIVGSNLHSNLAERFAVHFNGNDIIVINEEEHYTDRQASIVIHDKASHILPLII
ncbi:MAG: NAD-dependent protein deacylase [Acetivibrio sp.]